MSKDNPKNSTCIQVLLDMIASPHIDSENRIKVQELVKYLKCAGQPVVKDTDDRYKQHQYTDKSLTWNKLFNYDSTGSIDNLSMTAKAILMLYLRTAKQGGLVAIKKSVCMAIIHISDPKAYTKAHKQLIEYGCIAVKQHSHGHVPTVYMINPNLMNCGKDDFHVQEAVYKELGGLPLPPDTKYLTTRVKGTDPDTGKDYYYMTLVDRPPDKQQKAVSDTTDTAPENDISNLPFM